MADQTKQLIRRLEAQVAQLEAQVAQLQKENQRLLLENLRLREQLEEARRAEVRQAAPFRRDERAKIPPDQKKKPGRRIGHPGSCRSLPDHIDHIVEVPLERCPRCGGEVHDRRRLEQIIEEIPPVRPLVMKIITYEGCCARCGEVRSVHPLQTSLGQGAAKVQLGPRALALAAVLNKGHGVTMRKTCKVLKDLTGLRLTPGGLSQALSRVARRVKGEYERMIKQIRGSPAVFADETSWWVGGPGWWLWTFTTPQGTVYRIDESRGSKVVEDVLGENFAGMLVSDCLAAYDPIACRKHKCFSHHLKAISDAKQFPDTSDSSYLRHCELLFKTATALYDARPQMSGETFTERRNHIEAWADCLLAQPVSQPREERIRSRLIKQRSHLFGCLYEPAAEPTNNRAERSLRPAVIARKLSCGNKTLAGRDTWQVLASLGATCVQRCVEFTDFLASRLPLTAPAG